MNVPNGAQAVIDARKKGFKPGELLIVSLIGHLQELNHTIHANPLAQYDWRWVIGLKIVVFVKSGVDPKGILKAIAIHNPEWLAIYDVDQFAGAGVSYLPMVDDIEKPQSQWRRKLSFLPWIDCENRSFSWS